MAKGTQKTRNAKIDADMLRIIGKKTIPAKFQPRASDPSVVDLIVDCEAHDLDNKSLFRLWLDDRITVRDGRLIVGGQSLTRPRPGQDRP